MEKEFTAFYLSKEDYSHNKYEVKEPPVNKSITKLFLEGKKDKRPSLEEILDTISKNLDEETILIGGQTALPVYYGYRTMRKNSNDIDVFINNPEARLFKREGVVRCFENSYIVPGKVLIVIHYSKIHDYKPDKAFYDHIREYDGIKLNGPEYTILLKLLRAKEMKRLFGKDKIDIANILLSSEYKGLEIDYKFLKNQIKKHELDGYLRQLKERIPNINEEEQKTLNEILDTSLL